jgi:putative phosphoesterase
VLVLITADTHGPRHRTPDWLLRAAGLADIVVHAGDVCDLGTLQDFATLRPTYAVRGNRDDELQLPERLVLDCDGISLGVVHGHAGRGDDTSVRALATFAVRPDVVAFGHSHRYLLERRQGVWLVNPGSPTAPKDGSAGALLLEVRAGAVSWRRVGPAAEGA